MLKKNMNKRKTHEWQERTKGKRHASGNLVSCPDFLCVKIFSYWSTKGRAVSNIQSMFDLCIYTTQWRKTQGEACFPSAASEWGTHYARVPLFLLHAHTYCIPRREITRNADCVTHIYRSKAIRAARGEETKQGLIYKLYRRKTRKGIRGEKWRKCRPQKASVRPEDVRVVRYTKLDRWWWVCSVLQQGGGGPEFKWKCINVIEQSDTNEV